MPLTKISALTCASTPLAGTEVLPIIQSGATRKVANNDLRPKQIQSNATTGVLQVAGPSAGATRVMTTPDANFTAARTDAAQSFTGDQTLATGNLIIGTSSKGIDFSANGGDILSQYDEGTYTPVFTASSSNPTVTYGLQRGKYVRVGNSVTVSVFISWSAFSGGLGDLQISLPFAGESSVGAGGAGSISDLTGFTFAAGRTFCSVRPNSNVFYATFPQSGSLVSTSNTTVAQTAASGLIVFSTTYLI